MIFDITDRNKKMKESLDRFQKMVDRSEVEGFIILIRDNKGQYRQCMYSGRISDVDWIGSLEVCKSIILKDLFLTMGQTND